MTLEWTDGSGVGAESKGFAWTCERKTARTQPSRAHAHILPSVYFSAECLYSTYYVAIKQYTYAYAYRKKSISIVSRDAGACGPPGEIHEPSCDNRSSSVFPFFKCTYASAVTEPRIAPAWDGEEAKVSSPDRWRVPADDFRKAKFRRKEYTISSRRVATGASTLRFPRQSLVYPTHRLLYKFIHAQNSVCTMLF